MFIINITLVLIIINEMVHNIHHIQLNPPCLHCAHSKHNANGFLHSPALYFIDFTALFTNAECVQSQGTIKTRCCPAPSDS